MKASGVELLDWEQDPQGEIGNYGIATRPQTCCINTSFYLENRGRSTPDISMENRTSPKETWQRILETFQCRSVDPSSQSVRGSLKEMWKDMSQKPGFPHF